LKVRVDWGWMMFPAAEEVERKRKRSRPSPPWPDRVDDVFHSTPLLLIVYPEEIAGF
jgi:hypothetical protein